mmetsp:Transcript_3604/g.10956  ORF Transcript_3604/g.10956 Transcript_3604/m.10956 type:complete len:139 (+) Transcript_3604:3-419(+)
MGQCVAFEPADKVAFARLIVLLAAPQSPEVDASIVDTMVSLGVKTEKSDATFLAFLPRLVFCKITREMVKDQQWKVLMRRDKIIEQPVALFMAMRVGNLLRWFGLQLFENVSIADCWKPWAQRHLREAGACGEGEGAV